MIAYAIDGESADEHGGEVVEAYGNVRRQVPQKTSYQCEPDMIQQCASRRARICQGCLEVGFDVIRFCWRKEGKDE
jgi:hypothetical protein